MHVLEETILLPENTTHYLVRNLMPLYSYIFEVRHCFCNLNVLSKNVFYDFLKKVAVTLLLFLCKVQTITTTGFGQIAVLEISTLAQSMPKYQLMKS